MKKHVPFLLSLLSIMALLGWTISVHAQCSTANATLDLPIDGGAATDLSAFSHSVTIQGGAAFVAGQDGGSNSALQFSSQSDYATIAAHPAFEQMTEAFTIAAWIKPTSMLSDNAFLTKLNGSHRNFVFRFQSTGQLNFHFTRTGGLTFVVSATGLIVNNEWQHVAATWDGSDIRLFLNGEVVAQQAITEGPTFQSSGSVRIGTLNFSSERFNGAIDDIQFRSYAMNEGSIPCLMNHSMPLDEGLVLSLPLDGDGTDVSSYGNNGINNGAAASTDRFMNNNSSLSFSGSDYVSVGNQSQYSGLSSGFSISAWIKPVSVSGNHAIVSKSGTGRDVVLRVDNGKFTVHYYVGGYVWFVPANATILANIWTNVACTWDGTTMKLYQDGVEIYSLDPATTPTFTGNPWSIGALSNAGGESFGGDIDNVMVWDRALAPCELVESYHPAIDLVSEDNLTMCAGQTQTVIATSMCTYLWTTDNSTSNSFVINADNLGAGNHEIVLEAYDTYDHFYSDTIHVNVSLCTGIEEQENANTMKLMPNPASSIVNVSATDLAEIQLMDVSGRIIQQIAVVGSKETNIDISHLPAGMYLVSAKSTNGTVNIERLMKR
ncbi:MAG: T9SS type A sorting domain-containing protein [Flavobacteriales bacterium]|nr:T9SS type A sorting domain-containing protein [Flavobacteriales bacterium]